MKNVSYFKDFLNESNSGDFEQIYGISSDLLDDVIMNVTDEGFKVTQRETYRGIDWGFLGKTKPDHVEEFYSVHEISVKNSNLRKDNINGKDSVVYYNDPEILKMVYDFYVTVQDVFSKVTDVKVIYNLNYGQENLIEILLVKKMKNEKRNILSNRFNHVFIEGNNLYDYLSQLWGNPPNSRSYIKAYEFDTFRGSIDLKFRPSDSVFLDTKARYLEDIKRGFKNNLGDIYILSDFFISHIESKYGAKFDKTLNNLPFDRKSVISHFENAVNGDISLKFKIGDDSYEMVIYPGESKMYKIDEEQGSVLGIKRTKSHVFEIFKEFYFEFKKN